MHSVVAHNLVCLYTCLVLLSLLGEICGQCSLNPDLVRDDKRNGDRRQNLFNKLNSLTKEFRNHPVKAQVNQETYTYTIKICSDKEEVNDYSAFDEKHARTIRSLGRINESDVMILHYVRLHEQCCLDMLYPVYANGDHYVNACKRTERRTITALLVRMSGNAIQPVPEYWYDNFLGQKTFLVPISSDPSVDEVVITLDALPDRDEIVDEFLKVENPPMRFWNQIALHYLVRQRKDVFCHILEHAPLPMYADKQDAPQDLADSLLCMDLLANYYASKSVKETGDRKKEWVMKATVLYNQVDRMVVYNQYHLVGRAYFCLLDPDKMEQAKTQFDLVLKCWPEDPLALQGRGIVAFHQHDYKLALQLFQKLLMKYPGCSADIRMAIGHCLFKLNRYNTARMAYERALQLDNQCVGAMLGLAIILLNEGTPESVMLAMKYIAAVDQIDTANPISLNMLADDFFYRKEIDKAISLSTVALQTSYSDTLKAESAYMLGRSFHYEEDYNQAFHYYHQATQFAKAVFVLPWYGLGQMYVQREEYDSAMQCFETVLAQSPKNVETLRILGLMYLTTGDVEDLEKAKASLKKLTDLCPDDIDAHVKFAALQDSSDPRSALATYLRVLEKYNGRSSHDDAPPEFFSNISVLFFHLHDIPNSRKYLDRAKRRAEESQKDTPGGLLMTMTYNEGRLAEEARDFEEAEKIYRTLAKKHPGYVDSYIRLGCMERDRGFHQQAADWFQDAADMGQDRPAALLLLGNLCMSRLEYSRAEKMYEKVLQLAESKNDTYAMLSLGNIWLEKLDTFTPDPITRKRHADRAFHLYKQVLHIDPCNIYAVNGLGAVLAKMGQAEEAKEMFAVVRESSVDIHDLWLNIGHQHCEAKQYVAGMNMYDKALRRFGNALLDPQIYLYLARAQYLNGDLKDARRTLQIARHLVPTNSPIRFNLALVMKRMAVTTLEDFRAELQDAIADLTIAEEMFEDLALETDKTHLIDPARAQREARMCRDYKNQADSHLDRANETAAAQKLLRQKVGSSDDAEEGKDPSSGKAVMASSEEAGTVKKKARLHG